MFILERFFKSSMGGGGFNSLSQTVNSNVGSTPKAESKKTYVLNHRNMALSGQF